MRSRILVGLIAGAIGGLLGWLIQENMIPYNEIAREMAATGHVSSYLEAANFRAITLFVGGLIGLFLGSVDGVVEGNPRKIGQGMLVGALGGIVCGSIGYYVGNIVYNMLGGSNALHDVSIFSFARQVLARTLGWAGLGVGLGIGSALGTRSPKRIRNGALGGFLGGLGGGFIFDMLASAATPVQQTFANGGVQDVGGPSRLVGFTAIGALTGFLVGLVDELFKQAWVKVLAGRNEGKDFILAKPMNILGRDERADVPLYGDNSIGVQHAAIRADGKRHVLLDASTPAGTVVNGQRVAQGGELLLKDGDMIQIGTHRILFREKATQSQFSRAPVDVPKAAAGSPSNMPMPSHLCPFCGATKKADGSCLCTVAGGASAPVGNSAPMPVPSYGVPVSAPGFGSSQFNANAPLGSPVGAPLAGGSEMPRFVGMEGPYTGQVFLLTAPNMGLGRETDNDIALSADPTISRAHARIANENGDIVVYDNNSANGTFVNSMRIAMQVLAPGDMVQFGSSKFRYE